MNTHGKAFRDRPDWIEFSARHYHWLLAFLALAPLVVFWPKVSQIFWFGDEWDQLDLILTRGFWGWVASPFGENVAPLAKLTWGGLVMGAGGNYSLMLACVWALHVVNVGLLGAWMRAAKFRWFSVSLTLVVFGLASVHIESLGWSIVLIIVQATTFILAAGFWLEKRFDQHPSRGVPAVMPALLLLAAAFTSVRGVPTGAAFAASAMAGFIASDFGSRPSWRSVAVSGAILLTTTLFSGAMVARFATGNHQNMGGAGGNYWPAVEYAFYYWTLNPFHRLLDVAGIGYRTAVLLGSLKIFIIAIGLRRANPGQLRLLVSLLLFEFASAALLGLGRFHTGIGTTISSRYQYLSVICTFPFAALVLESMIDRIRTNRLRAGLAVVAVAVAAVLAVRRWPAELSHWASWRGKAHIQALMSDPSPPPTGAIPGIPSMPTDRAVEIMAHFDIDKHL